MWNLPGPGIEPVSAALAGGFLTHCATREVPEYVFLILLGMESGISGSRGTSMFSILMNCQTVLKAATPFYLPTGNVLIWGFQFLCIFTDTCYCLSFSFAILVSVTWYLIGFYLHFPNNLRYWASFHVFVGHLHFLFGEMSIQILCPFFIFIFWNGFLYILDKSPLLDI